jgi:hypothetical protein
MSKRKYLVGWLVAMQGPKDPKPRLYAAVAQQKAYPSLEHETGHAEALVGNHLSVTERAPRISTTPYGW